MRSYGHRTKSPEGGQKLPRRTAEARDDDAVDRDTGEDLAGSKTEPPAEREQHAHERRDGCTACDPRGDNRSSAGRQPDAERPAVASGSAAGQPDQRPADSEPYRWVVGPDDDRAPEANGSDSRGRQRSVPKIAAL